MSLFTLRRGDSQSLFCDVRLNKQPLDLSLYTVWFTAKYDMADQDSAAVMRKGMSAGLSGVSVITDPATDKSSRIKVAFTPADTAALPAKLVNLVFDIQIKAPTGEVFTVDDGQLQIKPDVTITTV